MEEAIYRVEVRLPYGKSPNFYATTDIMLRMWERFLSSLRDEYAKQHGARFTIPIIYGHTRPFFGKENTFCIIYLIQGNLVDFYGKDLFMNTLPSCSKAKKMPGMNVEHYVIASDLVTAEVLNY